MNDNFEIAEEKTTKPKSKSRKAHIELRDDIYLAIHGLYSSETNVKRGSIFALEGQDKIDTLLEVGAIRKIQDIEIAKLTSISKYHLLIEKWGYGSAGAFLSQSNSEIMETARIPEDLTMHIRKLIEDELSK